MPGQAYTYSFLDVQATLTGPGGSIPLGAGAGETEEGITFEPVGDVNKMSIGADGSGMHALIADFSAHVTVRLLKNSPTNQLLGAMLAFQRQSGANWGQNTVSAKNITSGDDMEAQQVAFAKVPVVTYDRDGRMNEWHFDAITFHPAFGAVSQ